MAALLMQQFICAHPPVFRAAEFCDLQRAGHHPQPCCFCLEFFVFWMDQPLS